jgi:hypothetical protein
MLCRAKFACCWDGLRGRAVILLRSAGDVMLYLLLLDRMILIYQNHCLILYKLILHAVLACVTAIGRLWSWARFQCGSFSDICTCWLGLDLPQKRLIGSRLGVEDNPPHILAGTLMKSDPIMDGGRLRIPQWRTRRWPPGTEYDGDDPKDGHPP